MTHLDLCTGIGGFHLAAEWAGFETLGFAEIEPYCCALLAEKWPQIKNYGDLRRADFSSLCQRIDVLSAGVPCQPASLAGKRRGKNDDRWLWPAVLAVIGTVEPAWVILENPDGILTLGEFGGVLLRLGEIGYALRAFRVPANAVGAKHRRYRVFIVAHAERERRDGWADGWGTAAGAGASVEFTGTSGNAEAVADAELHGPHESARRRSFGQSQDQGRLFEPEGRCAEAVADADQPGLQGRDQRGECADQRIAWSGSQSISFPRLTQPPLCGRVDGVFYRSYRLKALGNAVCPQQAYPFFAAIRQVERHP